MSVAELSDGNTLRENYLSARVIYDFSSSTSISQQSLCFITRRECSGLDTGFLGK